PTSGLERLVEKVVKAGLKAKPELGIQIGSDGDSGAAELAAESAKDIGDLADRGQRALNAGASTIMAESEGIPENRAERNTEAAVRDQSAKDLGALVDRGQRAPNAGASSIMVEAEGITENVEEWNPAAAAAIINGLGLENVMFEAADGPVFEWYIKNYGDECNLFVDHSQILQLEGLRQNIWGNKSTWVRVINPAP